MALEWVKKIDEADCEKYHGHEGRTVVVFYPEEEEFKNGQWDATIEIIVTPKVYHFHLLVINSEGYAIFKDNKLVSDGRVR